MKATVLSRSSFCSITVVAMALTASGCSKATQPITNNVVTSATTTTSTNTGSDTTINLNSDIAKTLTANLLRAGIKQPVKSILKTDSPALLWVSIEDMPSVYATADGQFIIQGDVLKLEDQKITDMKSSFLKAEASRLLAAVPRTDSIVFNAMGTVKKVIYVFTDTDCGYCRKFHANINQINAKGIEVRYLAWPRAEQFVPIMESIWCSKDRNTTLTAAKNEVPIEPKICQNPVLNQRTLGMTLGVQGTPAIFSADGKQLGGYLSPSDLASKLGL